MKAIHWLFLFLVACTIFGAGFQYAIRSSYSMTSFSIGGVRSMPSTGGTLSLTGGVTHDAQSTMLAGFYGITGGFVATTQETEEPAEEGPVELHLPILQK